MEEYILDLIDLYHKYGVKKYFFLYGFMDRCDNLCIWENEEEIMISDLYDFIYRDERIKEMNEEFSLEIEAPRAIYVTSDPDEISTIINIASKKDYEEKLYDLLELAQRPRLKLN